MRFASVVLNVLAVLSPGILVGTVLSALLWALFELKWYWLILPPVILAAVMYWILSKICIVQ